MRPVTFILCSLGPCLLLAACAAESSERRAPPSAASTAPPATAADDEGDAEEDAPVTEQSATALSLADWRRQGLIPWLGKPVQLDAVIAWEQATVAIPEAAPADPQAGPLTLRFGPADDPAFAAVDARRREIRLRGDALGRTADAGWRFGQRELTAGKRYSLTVIPRLRERFDDKLLKNRAFVEQSRDPRYWSQTFVLDLLQVDAAD